MLGNVDKLMKFLMPEKLFALLLCIRIMYQLLGDVIALPFTTQGQEKKAVNSVKHSGHLYYIQVPAKT